MSYVLLSIQIDLQITTGNLKNEDTAKSHCFFVISTNLLDEGERNHYFYERDASFKKG